MGGSSAEEVKVDLEPLVDIGVDGVVLVTDLLRGQPFLPRLVLGGRPVLIGPTDVQQIPAPLAAIPEERETGRGAKDCGYKSCSLPFLGEIRPHLYLQMFAK